MKHDWEALGARLQAAREAAGFTQEEIAEQLGISRAAVSQLEAGRTRLDSLTLRRLATLYRRPIESFFDEELAEESVDELVLAKIRALPAKDRAVISRFLEFCTNLAFLRRELERPSKVPPPPRPLASRARKYAAEAAATQQRAELGLGNAPVGERLFELLEAVGVPTYRARLEDPRVSGLLVNHPEAGPVIFVNASQYRWRQVFTAAHEFGHLLFHRSHQPVACRIFDGAGDDEDVSGEQFVNAFASEFLMPEDGIKRYLLEVGAESGRLEAEQVVRLQRHFGVSFQAMVYRLLRLRLITDGDVRKLTTETRPVVLAWQLGYAIEADEFGESPEAELDLTTRFPREYIALVLDAFEQRRISNGRAAELLELERAAFDRLYRMIRRAGQLQKSEEGLEHVVS